MRIKDKMRDLLDHLESQGFKGRIVSINHVKDLRTDITEKRRQGLFDQGFYRIELTSFDFKVPERISETGSLIIVAAPQPQVRITFSWNGQSFPCIIPPTYSYSTDNQVKSILDKRLGPLLYHPVRNNLPLKLLAVRSGLARYGRNNITFIHGMGSFHRLVAFYSNLPCSEDNWREPVPLERCVNCTACMKACPTGAIPSDRFLLRAERCITFHNEHQGEFPRWISPEWHNCLVGCLSCQRICPENKDVLNKVEEGPTFSHEETALLLQGTPRDRLPHPTKVKLENLSIIEYSDMLGRNLKALFST